VIEKKEPVQRCPNCIAWLTVIERNESETVYECAFCLLCIAIPKWWPIDPIRILNRVFAR
jgi:hypothetical protein